jgi:hypothetical protein
MVSFSEALVAVKAGKAIQRSGWEVLLRMSNSVKNNEYTSIDE